MTLFQRVGDGVGLWALCLDNDKLVHWRRYEATLPAVTLPLCYEFSGRSVSAPARRATMPTCVHCILVPMKPVAS